VCCLIKGAVSRPSDIDGLVYKQILGSIEAIGYPIIKELQAAGYTIKI
jgi:predicted nucleotide-binding protein